MKKPRIMLVLQKALGWGTYADRMRSVAEARGDIELSIYEVTPNPRAMMFDKRHNMSRLDRVLRRRDPISHYRNGLGERIRAAVASFDPDVVHFAGHLPAAAIAFENAAPPFTCALDVTRAAMERDLPRGVWTAAEVDRDAAVMRAAAHLFPMSSWTARSLSEDCGVDPEIITIVPPSVPIPIETPANAINNKKLQIIFIGNDFLRKGGDKLCSWVEGPLAGLVELHVVSADPLAKGNRAGITFHGKVPNQRVLGEILPLMDVLCLPSKSDMSPYVIVEAASMGVPSIASNITGIKDTIVEAETGFLVPATDSEAFVKKLKFLAEHRGTAKQMGENARQFATKTLNATINCNTVIDMAIKVSRGD